MTRLRIQADRVIDGCTDRPLEGQAVDIEGSRIVRLAPADGAAEHLLLHVLAKNDDAIGTDKADLRAPVEKPGQ